MRCVVCRHGDTAEGVATVTLERDGLTVVVRGVPADVCEDCGEEYVDEEAARELFAALDEAESRGVRFELREFVAV